MRKIVLLVVAVMMFSACSKSPEEKANVLIKEHMQKTLYHPDTYDPAETVIDSAFYPDDDPELHQKLHEVYKLAIQLSELDEEVKRAKSKMSLWSNPFSEYSRNEYKQAKEEYESLLVQQDKLQKKGKKMKVECDSLGEKLKKDGKKFIGFKATHTFRCQNNAGQTVFGNQYYLFDKEMTRIVETFDLDSDEYQTLKIAFDLLENGAESNVEK